MQLVSYKVTKFRNIVDSGEIRIDPKVTCLVGKNEAGKSGLLEALYLFNPAYSESFSTDEHYPRWLSVADRKKGDLKEHAPVSVTFELNNCDFEVVSDDLGEGVLTGDSLTVERKYSGGTTWSFSWSEKTAIKNLIANFPDSVVFSGAPDNLNSLKEEIENLVPDAEDGPTTEDIENTKSILESKGLDKVSIWQRVVNILRPQLPVFFRFTSYSTLPGRIDFQEIADIDEAGPGRSDLQTAKALLSLAGTDMEQLGNDDYELRRGELEAVQIDLTKQVFEYWKQNPHLEVLIDVDKETVSRPNNVTAVARYLDIRLRDRRTGYSNNFNQRSSGFQWFFSFLAAFSEFEGKRSPIVLLDEPALTLHGKAQADFLRFINERIATNSTVIYTTHSPFMIEVDGLERVRVVDDLGPPEGAVVSDQVMSSDPDSLFPLQAALGYDIAQSLFVGNNNLVVEGTSDYLYLTLMSQICIGNKRAGLNENWRVLPAGGATNIPTFVSLIGPHLDITVLADSDTTGMQRVTNMVEKGLLDNSRLILASVATDGNKADIEDLFSEGDYLKLYNKTYSSSLKLSDLPAGDRIVKRIEAHIGNKYIHGEVAETFLRNHQEFSFTETSLTRFENLISTINSTINT